MPVDVTNHLADGWALFNGTDYAGAEAAFRAATVENPGDVSARIALGFSLIELGRAAEAIQLFSDASSSVQPGSVEQGMNLQGWAVALRKLEQFADAETKAQLLVELFPSYAYGWYLLGLIQFDRQDFANAVLSFRAALEKEPEDIPSADKLVDTLVALKRWDDALLALSDLDRLQKAASRPDRARTLRNWAILLRDGRDLGGADLKATELVTAFPEYAPGWNTRALIRQAQGNADGAIDDFQEAVSRGDGQPDRAKWLLNLADALRKAGRNDEAIQRYRELIAVDPNNASTHNSLGLVLEQRDPDAAIVEFEKAVSLWKQSNSGDRKFPLRNWANILIDRKQMDVAEATLREAIEADRNDPETRNSLAFVLLAQERSDPAIEECEEAVRLWRDLPDRRYAMRLWAEALNAKREYKSAKTKCKEALEIPGDLDGAWIQHALGKALLGLGEQDQAIVQLEEARRLATESNDSARRNIFWVLGDALLNRERIKEALVVYQEAVPLSPQNESWGHFYYGVALATAGDTDAALLQYEQAISADDKHPYAHNNKADLLFRLGRYEEGWKAWEIARVRFDATRAVFESDSTEAGQILREDAIERAVYYANALRDVFADYEESSQWYDLALRAHPGHLPAVCGRAVLLRRRFQSDRSKTTLQIEASQAMREACERLDAIKLPDPFAYRMMRADLLIEDRDWERLGETLDRAQDGCEEMRLRRAQILARLGILFLATDKPEKAARVFRQALIDRSDDLGSMTYLGQALLNAKRYEAAQEAFKVVLDKAPANVESLIGSARASIELADDGDMDQYEIAEKLLTKSIRFGREGGSTKLGPNDLADVYSMRGYARAKLYDGDKSGFHPFLITQALRDFRQARKHNPNHGPAQSACKKIVKEITRRTRDSLSDVIGTVLVSVAAAMVFVFAQVDFFLRGSWLHHVLGLPASSILDKPSYYATVTFGALALMIAGVSLGKLLKLKVGGIELEKASADQFAPAAVLDIGRFGLFENFVLTGLRGLAANVNDVPPQAAGREGQNPQKTEKYRGSSEHSTSEATRNQGPKPEL